MVAQRQITAFWKQSYKNQTIRIDGIQFIECHFDFCTLEFAGEALPIFKRCTLVDVSWSMVGAAANTISLLDMIYNDFGQGGKDFIELVFDIIRHSGSDQEAGEIRQTMRGADRQGLHIPRSVSGPTPSEPGE